MKPRGLILEHLRRLAAYRNPDVSDQALLAQFAEEQDQEAFATLLRRHGPMVLRTCQRMLPLSPDAEDVFQAVFLVLARKAGALRWQKSVAGWLHRVARQLAWKARRAQVRRQAHEGQAAHDRAVDPLAELTVREAQVVIDTELAALPEKYRLPLILCYLQGATRDEASRQLGLSQATLDGNCWAAAWPGAG